MQNTEQEKKDKRNALIIAALFHLLLTVLFMFFGLKEPNPLPKDEGVAIALDFGFSETGSGNNPSSTQVSPQPTPNPEPQPQEVVQPTPTPTPTQPATVQETSPVEAPVEETPPVEELPTEEPRQVNENLKSALTNAFTKTGGGSEGDGDDNEQGNKGKPEGGEGRGALGNGAGSWELAGRSLVKASRIEDTKEEGIVVLDIWVDRSGNVVRSSVNFQESNTTSSYLINIAREAAKKYKYNPQANAAAEQKGKMTFTFILK
jgi:TonB family protein